ncbi:CPBP family intramembrane metalloprotease [Abyssibius alkaniclasticus]|uniref:CPBP family intramembrane glutamic endopeptidase n=1 Tax=Abyssibius alkaniclasticus TaxID=2881234 RepID=UPI002363366F|nr:type II CAAX endopeptidase family protein [Abyssibius alkaniclasticus]UPH72080.1 CPBP family intramembrane metalloprotease [Abyssibius alkaniclasticus]
MHRQIPTLNAYCAPAVAYCGPGRTLVGGLAVVLLPALVVLALAAVFYYVLIPYYEAQQIGAGYVMLVRATSLGTEIARGQTPRAVLFVVGLVLIVLPSLWLVLRKLHHRPFRSLFGPTLRLNWRHMAWGFGVVLLASLLRPATLLGPMPQLAMPAIDWAALMFIALPLIFAQAFTEEAFFRGYLQQQLAARFASPLVWMLIPSLLFGLISYRTGTAPLQLWLNIGLMAALGALAADVTARTGNLGAAIGLHFGNSLYMLALHATGTGASGLALLQSTARSETTAALHHFLPLALAWLLFRILMARRNNA